MRFKENQNISDVHLLERTIVWAQVASREEVVDLVTRLCVVDGKMCYIFCSPC